MTLLSQHRHELSSKEEAKVLESHLSLKLNRDSNIKERAVSGGNKQRYFIIKEESSSPTVATKAFLLSCVIDAQENQDVVTTDIPYAFIQTCVDKIDDMETIIVQLALVDVMFEIETNIYGPYVSTAKKRVKTLILR